jgi:raffinose/stachyose/melibiose transport system substrate-binding protein
MMFSFMDPGRVGHVFQSVNAAWSTDGAKKLVAVSNGTGTIANDASMLRMSQRFLEIVSYGNADAFSIPDTVSWDGFANGRAAMLIMGSYARGTIMISNPRLKLGVFPLPNDVNAPSTLVAGIDAALCISASATQQQKQAGLAYMEFLTRPENAQTFCDIEGAPNCVSTVVFPDPGMVPIMNKMRQGPIHDWFSAMVPGNVMNAIYAETQQFLLDKNTQQFLTRLQQTIINESR